MFQENIFSTFKLNSTIKNFLTCYQPQYAYLYYKNFKIDLLTGERHFSSLSEVELLFKSKDIGEFYARPKVFHFFFELGYYFFDLEELIDENSPLFITIEYHRYYFHRFKDELFHHEAIKFDTSIVDLQIDEAPEFKDYRQKFQQVQENLQLGNSYQLNLTCPFYGKFNGGLGLEPFISHLLSADKQLSAYAHLTFIPQLERMYFSNSPECLFTIDKHPIEGVLVNSFPIKGTVSISDKRNTNQAWVELLNSSKNESELYIISDLIRNDLTKLSQNPSVILEHKGRLEVPGLIHQYSHIQTHKTGSLNLFELLNSLFPGGSITGAPKKRVLQLTKDIEGYNRGFYCGSTLLLFGSQKRASINIRSSEWNITQGQGEFFYGAGGGITIGSQVKDEYREMILKVKSFLDMYQRHL